MIDIYLCEDNTDELKLWSDLVEDYLMMQPLYGQLRYKTENPEVLLTCLRENAPDMGLYFLDICLNNSINGLQLAKEIRKIDPFGNIVFITSRSEMSYLTFEYHVEALDFIIKDNQLDLPTRMRTCMDLVFEKHKKCASSKQQKSFCLKIGSEHLYLDPEDIVYLETSNTSAHKITIYTSLSVKSVYGTLKEFESALEKFSVFFRCHQSVLVNTSFIQTFDTTAKTITLKSGIKLPVSARCIRALKHKNLVFTDSAS